MVDSRFERDLECFSAECEPITKHRKRKLDIHFFWVCNDCQKTNWLAYKKHKSSEWTLIPFHEISEIHNRPTEKQLLAKDISKGKTIARHGWMKEYRTRGDE